MYTKIETNNGKSGKERKMSAFKKAVFGVGVVVVSLAVAGVSSAKDYSHKITNKGMTFQWTVNGANLDVQISAPTTGWVGIGFNPSHDMKDANIIMGYVKDGQAKVSNEFGTTDTSHEKHAKVGGKDSVSGVSGKEENGVTTIDFTIPLKTGDPKDKVITVNGETAVIMAYGPRDSMNVKHSARTMFKVNLSTGK
jgi:hypothetical protein